MKKRFISLFLCIAMMVSACAFLTSCGSDGNVAEDSAIKPMTITLAMITNEETTPEGIKVVQDAINKITEDTLNTHVVLQFYTEDDYKVEVQKKLYARMAEKEAGVVRSSMGKETDVVLNQYGREIVVYPEPYDNQIDIFMVADYNELWEYYSKEMVADLNEAFVAGTGNSILMNKYVSPELMNFGKINDVQYAIPSNSLYGEYEYLLINKELFDGLNYDIDEVTDLNSIGQYLIDVANHHPDAIPLYNINEMGLESVTGKASVVASYIPEGSVLNADTAFSPTNILMIEEIRKTLTTINSFASINGDYPIYTEEVDFSQKFGAAYLKGNNDIPEKYEEDYYVLRHKGPVAETSEVYSSMFAVSNYSTDPMRCMEVITLINTNEEFRNLLLYGVENETYTVDEITGIIHRIKTPIEGTNVVYSMDMYKTGNLFLVWPNSDMTETEMMYAANDWELAKSCAREAHYSPNIGFALKHEVVGQYDPQSYNGLTVDEASIQLELLYDELWVKLREYGCAVDTTTGEDAEFEAFLTTIERWLASNQYVIFGVSNKNSDIYTFNKQYRQWYEHVVYPDGVPEA